MRRGERRRGQRGRRGGRKGRRKRGEEKEEVGEDEVEGETYYEVKVTFREEGGGTDFEDEFLYWIHKENFTVDYLAYRLVKLVSIESPNLFSLICVPGLGNISRAKHGPRFNKHDT